MAAKDAKSALLAYGYTKEDDGRYRQRRPDGTPKRTQVWEETEGGWLRYDFDGVNEVPEVYQVSDAYAGVSGLDKRQQPEAFVWVWPSSEIERIYG